MKTASTDKLVFLSQNDNRFHQALQWYNPDWSPMSHRMTLPDFLTCGDLGDIRLTGHRIGLGKIFTFYLRGDSAEALQARFPSLPLSLIHRTLAFYLENEPEVTEYVRQHDSEMDRIRNAAGGTGPGLEELRRRYAWQALAPPAEINGERVYTRCRVRRLLRFARGFLENAKRCLVHAGPLFQPLFERFAKTREYTAKQREASPVTNQETELSVLQEIRDEMRRHHAYCEERDQKSNAYLDNEAARVLRQTERVTKATFVSQIIFGLAVAALAVIAAQLYYLRARY